MAGQTSTEYTEFDQNILLDYCRENGLFGTDFGNTIDFGAYNSMDSIDYSSTEKNLPKETMVYPSPTETSQIFSYQVDTPEFLEPTGNIQIETTETFQIKKTWNGKIEELSLFNKRFKEMADNIKVLASSFSKKMSSLPNTSNSDNNNNNNNNNNNK